MAPRVHMPILNIQNGPVKYKLCISSAAAYICGCRNEVDCCKVCDPLVLLTTTTEMPISTMSIDCLNARIIETRCRTLVDDEYEQCISTISHCRLEED